MNLERTSKKNLKISARSAAMRKAYVKYRKSLQLRGMPCPLCVDVSDREIVQSHPLFSVIKNDFPYYFFESVRVRSHLMLVPRRYIVDFPELTDDEASEYMEILREYSAQGYSSLTRSESSAQRSIQAHLHTHLLLTR